MFPVSDPILVFTVLALAILVAPVLAGRLRIPDLVLLLAFGALLGPHGLHILERSSAVTMLGAVGLLYIMFLAGLEIDLYRFRQSYRRSLWFGLLTFAIPQGLGTLAGRHVLGLEWPAAVLLASMFASHTLLAYPLASRLGISRTEPVAITLGATIITDTLALMVLAVVADSVRGDALGPLFWATICIGMGVLCLLAWKGIPFVARWFFRRVTEESNAQFLFVLVLLCGFAYLSHFARLEPIIGAFLAGAAFNRLIPEHSPLMNRVVFVGHTLFIPFFLISVGMLVDMGAMFTGTRSWTVGATMVAMVVATKYAAAWLARTWFGYSKAAGHVMFGLSVVQAAATLAAVVVGYNLEIFDAAVLNGAIMMILATCPLGAWMVDRYGRRMVIEAPARSAAPEREQRILVPVAKPGSATRLLDLAFMLRNAARPGGIYPLAIALDGDDAERMVEQGEKLLGYCLAHAASADMAVEPGLRIALNVSDSIVQASKELRSGMVLIGWSDRQAASIRIFGSVMNQLVEHCPARLFFCRVVEPLNTAKRVLVPFPQLASRCRNIDELVRDAKRLAHGIGAELRIYTPGSADAGALREMAEKAKPECPVSVVEKASWPAVRHAMFEEIASGDVVLLPLDRRNGLLWTPELDRLPELVASRFPETSLLAAYPSLPPPGRREDAEAVPAAAAPGFPALLAIDLLDGMALDDALRKMAEAAFPERPDDAHAAWTELRASAQSFPVELAPGTVLLHARSGHPERPLLMICHAPGGWRFDSLPNPSTVILALLGSRNTPPEDHLRTLSAVARRMHEIHAAPAFQSATSSAGLCAAFNPQSNTDPGGG